MRSTTPEPRRATVATEHSAAPSLLLPAVRVAPDTSPAQLDLDEQLSVLDVLPEGAVVADPSGMIIFANAALTPLLGWESADLVGQPVQRIVPERFRSAHGAGFASLMAGETKPKLYGQAVRLPALTSEGNERMIELLLAPLALSSGTTLVLATLRNVDERLELERHGRVVDRLLAVLADDPENLGPKIASEVAQSLDWDWGALWVVDANGRSLSTRDIWHRPGLEGFADATQALHLVPGQGLPGQVSAVGEPRWIADLSAERAFLRGDAAKEAGLQSGFAFPLLDDDQVVGVLEFFSFNRREPETALLDQMGVMGRRLGSILAHLNRQQEREEIVRELRLARASQTELLRSQDFLLTAALVLAQATGFEEALNRLAVVAVPLLGDICIIDVLDGSGKLTRAAVHHVDPAKHALITELSKRVAPGTTDAHPAVRAVRTGRSQWSATIDDELLRATTEDEEHLAIVRGLNFTSYMSVPLRVSDRILGCVTLVSSSDTRRYEESDLVLAEALAAHAAAVIDRASRHDRVREAAHILQRGLLPYELPTIPGLLAIAHYEPASEGAEVGGDWYDLMPLADGTVGMAIGDVAGHDIGAAAEMGQLRNGLLAYAVRDSQPAVVLDELRRFTTDIGLRRIATAVYARISPESGEVRMASAGHIPPLIRRAGGEVEYVVLVPSPPLGVTAEVPQEWSGVLAPGDALLMLTDGLVERRGRDVDSGLRLLANVLTAAPRKANPTELSRIINEHLAQSGKLEDDVAYLIVQRTPEGGK